MSISFRFSERLGRTSPSAFVASLGIHPETPSFTRARKAVIPLFQHRNGADIGVFGFGYAVSRELLRVVNFENMARRPKDSPDKSEGILEARITGIDISLHVARVSIVDALLAYRNGGTKEKFSSAVSSHLMDGHTVNLSGQDLSGLDLSGIQFGPYANFSYCHAIGVNWTRAGLPKAWFNGANLQHSNFLGIETGCHVILSENGLYMHPEKPDIFMELQNCYKALEKSGCITHERRLLPDFRDKRQAFQNASRMPDAEVDIIFKILEAQEQLSYGLFSLDGANLLDIQNAPPFITPQRIVAETSKWVADRLLENNIECARRTLDQVARILI